MAALSGSEEERKEPADSSRRRAFKSNAPAVESIPDTAEGGKSHAVKIIVGGLNVSGSTAAPKA